MLKKIKKKSGETLLEVIIAIMLVAMGSATAATLIMQALSSNQFNRDSLVALNLAQEGLEMMKMTIDTNWLKYSGNFENCWNVKPDAMSCNNDNRIEEGNYAWGVKMSNNIGTALDLGASGLAAVNNSDYRLYEFEVGDDDDSKVLFVGSNDGSDATPGNESATKYYRSVEVRYKQYDASYGLEDVTSESGHLDGEVMLLTSKVQWKGSGGLVQQVVLNKVLSKYK